MIELKVEFFASSVIVRPKLWRNTLSKFSGCDMIFDTGASMTTIDTSVALRSGYSLKDADNIFVTGVGRNKIPAKRIVIPNIKLNDFELGPILVNVLEFPEGSSALAVLGMNVIKEFRVTADFKDKRPEPDGRDASISLEPTFDIKSKPTYEDFIPTESRFGIWSMKSLSQL